MLIHSTLVLLLASLHATGSVSVLEDATLDGGFRLSAVRSSANPVEVSRVLAVDNTREAAWRLCQWGTRFSLEGCAETVTDAGARCLANQAKEVVIYPGGLAGEGVRLAVNGGVEYGDSLRAQGQAWAHLLVEQKLEGPRLNEVTGLEFALDFCVESCKAATDKPMDPGLHTAHITAFWTIHNVNAGSPDHNDMIWFGVPLFDARYPVPHGHQAVDTGQADATGKFICTIEGARFYPGPVTVGAWNVLRCDLVPLIAEALQASKSKGFLEHTALEDLALTSFNLGWEVPGSYDCAIHVRHLRLDALPTATVSAPGK